MSMDPLPPVAPNTTIESAAQNALIDRVNALSPGPWTDVVFQNGWSNLGGGRQTAQWRRVGDRVEMRGAIAAGTVNTVAFTLPDGARPKVTQPIPASGFGTSPVAVIVSVAPTGAVTIFTTTTTEVDLPTGGFAIS